MRNLPVIPEVDTDPAPESFAEPRLFRGLPLRTRTASVFPMTQSGENGSPSVVDECARIRSAKDALPRVELHAQDF